tara:strand:- start:141 stop:317 length:177 start_codon:yes stop_codon:yes gene_type:complete
MRLPKEYRKYAVPGGYEKCTNKYGRRMLRKFGFGPVVEAAPVAPATPKKNKVAKKKTD